MIRTTNGGAQSAATLAYRRSWQGTRGIAHLLAMITAAVLLEWYAGLRLGVPNLWVWVLGGGVTTAAMGLVLLWWNARPLGSYQ